MLSNPLKQLYKTHANAVEKQLNRTDSNYYVQIQYPASILDLTTKTFFVQ
jgi:hypothetical protein